MMDLPALFIIIVLLWCSCHVHPSAHAQRKLFTSQTLRLWLCARFILWLRGDEWNFRLLMLKSISLYLQECSSHGLLFLSYVQVHLKKMSETLSLIPDSLGWNSVRSFRVVLTPVTSVGEISEDYISHEHLGCRVSWFPLVLVSCGSSFDFLSQNLTLHGQKISAKPLCLFFVFFLSVWVCSCLNQRRLSVSYWSGLSAAAYILH